MKGKRKKTESAVTNQLAADEVAGKVEVTNELAEDEVLLLARMWKESGMEELFSDM